MTHDGNGLTIVMDSQHLSYVMQMYSGIRQPATLSNTVNSYTKDTINNNITTSNCAMNSCAVNANTIVLAIQMAVIQSKSQYRRQLSI